MELRMADLALAASVDRAESSLYLRWLTVLISVRACSAGRMMASLSPVIGLVILGLSLAGCVSKSKAESQARAAFLAGQQQTAQQLQPAGPTVTVIGEVKNKLLPWALDLTLAKALVAAEYYGTHDPTQIIVIREGHIIPVDPRRLLEGEDFLLLPRDIVEVKGEP